MTNYCPTNSYVGLHGALPRQVDWTQSCMGCVYPYPGHPLPRQAPVILIAMNTAQGDTHAAMRRLLNPVFS